MTTDRIGQQLGNYTITQLLGQGGFADVYLGEHIYLKSQAAVKVLQARLSGADDMDSFLKEAQTIARLFHPHIIRIMDFGVAAETPYLVMDYAPKGTLRQKHPRGTPVPLTTVVSYVKQIADALQYAHDEVRLIHRDIKPENMLIGRRDEIVLSDFGIALVAQSSRYQGTQDVIGTVAYMAPEQIQGKPRAASDQYSLAVVVYEWLTGDRPFHGSFTEMCTQHIFAPPPPLREKAPSLPHHIDLVVMQALAKDPQQRFENIQAFANALEQVSLSQGGEHTEQMPPTFHSLLTNNTVDAAYPPTLIPSPPTNTPSLPLQTGTPGQLFTLPAQSGRPAQPPQQQVVLPAQPKYNPQYPGEGNVPQHPSQFAPQAPSYRSGEAQRAQQTQYPPRPDNTQQAQQFPSHPSRTPQQSARPEALQPQAMAPQRPAPEARYNAPPVHSGTATQPTDEGTDEGLGMFAPLVRPLIATIAGIALFCIAIVFHPSLFGRPMLFTMAIPLIFGVAFGPIVGLLVGLGGVFCLNLIGLPYFISLYDDYTFLREHFISLHTSRFWWNPLLINGLIGFMAGLSMLRKRRFPTIGSVIRGTILGTIGLFGSISVILYSQFGLSVFLHSLLNIGLLSSANVLVAFALLIIYSILGRLLDPGA
ncbi:MAG TPA: protein kinase [Ktedonobacteraceae bacterium]